MRYALELKKKENIKKTDSKDMKEVKLTFNIAEHDYGVRQVLEQISKKIKHDMTSRPSFAVDEVAFLVHVRFISADIFSLPSFWLRPCSSTYRQKSSNITRNNCTARGGQVSGVGAPGEVHRAVSRPRATA